MQFLISGWLTFLVIWKFHDKRKITVAMQHNEGM
jgi:hypothetical protein